MSECVYKRKHIGMHCPVYNCTAHGGQVTEPAYEDLFYTATYVCRCQRCMTELFGRTRESGRG